MTIRSTRHAFVCGLMAVAACYTLEAGATSPAPTKTEGSTLTPALSRPPGEGEQQHALGGGAPEIGTPIQLPPPRMDGGKPLLQTLRERQSLREFSAKPLSPQLLSSLLWAGFGINRPQIAHRTAPSAMNSQEIDLYVATADGVFLYDAKANRLQPVLGEDVRKKTGGQDFVKTAPVALLFVADLSRLAKAQPADRERYAWMDSGYISQNIYLFCASEGLATVVHELTRGPLKEVLKLRPDQTLILAQSVGFPKEPSAGAGAR